MYKILYVIIICINDNLILFQRGYYINHTHINAKQVSVPCINQLWKFIVITFNNFTEPQKQEIFWGPSYMIFSMNEIIEFHVLCWPNMCVTGPHLSPPRRFFFTWILLGSCSPIIVVHHLIIDVVSQRFDPIKFIFPFKYFFLCMNQCHDAFDFHVQT